MTRAALIALSLLAWALVLLTAFALPPFIAGYLHGLQLLPGITYCPLALAAD